MKLFRRLFLLFSKIFHKLGHLSYSSSLEKKVNEWFSIDGDYTLRLLYSDLNEDSLVFDLGGYKGQWSSDIYAIYNCNIYIFEPVKDFFYHIENRFNKNNKITAYNFGLSNSNRKVKINLDNNESSIYNKSNSSKNEVIELKDFIEFFDSKKTNFIDLIKINIEGGEYELLEYILNKNYISNIKNLQIQFHSFIPESNTRMKNIQEKLKLTHKLTYQYKFVWENWVLKNN